ncbi:LacI family DNA-binding transcriptional regulator [Pedobacter insulae]|nr:LacI family DNA-binding transcriptional regulator [Pedobacter insulae]
MNKNITLQDIAKALNISASTVSRALTDSYQIGAKTKKLVLDYAKQHHYVPNRMARGLKEGKSRSIGVLVCSIDNNFMAQMLDGIDQHCSERGYQIIIMQSKELYEQEKANVDLLYASGIDGLLISPSYQTVDFSHLTHLQELGVPVVLFDRLSKHIDTHKVAVDNFKGAYDATMHLINNGYKKIAHINWDTELSVATKRFEGYKQALEDSGIKLNNDWIKFIDTTNAETLTLQLDTALQELMDFRPSPKAIFTATDLISTKCLALLHKRGYSVPKDIALIGFSNTDLADVLNPSLSTVHQPSFEIGSLAAQQLLSLINGKDTNSFQTILLPTELQIRASSQPKN